MTGTGKGRSEPPGCLNRSIMVRPAVTEIAAVERRKAQPPFAKGGTAHAFTSVRSHPAPSRRSAPSL